MSRCLSLSIHFYVTTKTRCMYSKLSDKYYGTKICEITLSCFTNLAMLPSIWVHIVPYNEWVSVKCMVSKINIIVTTCVYTHSYI